MPWEYNADLLAGDNSHCATPNITHSSANEQGTRLTVHIEKLGVAVLVKNYQILGKPTFNAHVHESFLWVLYSSQFISVYNSIICVFSVIR
jgi:hypothetical protein